MSLDMFAKELRELVEKHGVRLGVDVYGDAYATDGTDQLDLFDCDGIFDQTCATCGMPFDVHAEAFGIREVLAVSNCAVANGAPKESCQMCLGNCAGRHAYKRSS